MRIKNQYFKKDKQADIYHLKETGVNEYGIPTYEYEKISDFSLWCYASQISMDKAYIAMALDTKETRFFVFNNLGDKVAPLDYVVYKNKWYRITRIDTKDDYNTDMFIYVYDENRPGNIKE